MLKSTFTIKPDAKRLAAKPRMVKCEHCGTKFEKRRIGQRACGPICAVAVGQKDKAKAERKTDAVRKEKLKTRSDWMREAQAAFNAYRREWCRVNGFTTCPCCDEPLDWNSNAVDAGHYRSVGSAPHMRFTENNVWAQRKQCNRYGAGRAVDYRIGLIKRIGLEAVEALEADQTPRKWSIDDLKAIRAHYKAKLKELKAAE